MMLFLTLSQCGSHKHKRRLPSHGLGAACTSTLDCAQQPEPLRCIEGQCEQAQCPMGDVACACFPNDTCSPLPDRYVACNAQHRCELRDCLSPNATCGCSGKPACETIAIRVIAPSARACDFVIYGLKHTPLSVRYHASIQARFDAQANQVGVSFALLRDVPLNDAAIVMLLGHAQDVPALSQATCYTEAGLAIPSTALVLERNATAP